MDPLVNRIPCAVLYAGMEVQLAIEARQGRAPVRVLCTAPTLRWWCADGQVEELLLEAPHGAADLQRLAGEINSRGLLVTELDEAKPGTPGAGTPTLSALRASGDFLNPMAPWALHWIVGQT